MSWINVTCTYVLAPKYLNTDKALVHFGKLIMAYLFAAFKVVGYNSHCSFVFRATKLKQFAYGEIVIKRSNAYKNIE